MPRFASSQDAHDLKVLKEAKKVEQLAKEKLDREQRQMVLLEELEDKRRTREEELRKLQEEERQ
jgi:hypothetical protein